MCKTATKNKKRRRNKLLRLSFFSQRGLLKTLVSSLSSLSSVCSCRRMVLPLPASLLRVYVCLCVSEYLGGLCVRSFPFFFLAFLFGGSQKKIPTVLENKKNGIFRFLAQPHSVYLARVLSDFFSSIFPFCFLPFFPHFFRVLVCLA